jgi:5,10-methylenetetrahydromethanopterin reductase
MQSWQTMRFSLRLNNDLPACEYAILARAAEQAGFDQFWVSNDLFLRASIPILMAVANATQRLEVGTGILNPYTIHPAEIAMLASTMDELTGNRFNLGLAAGAAEFLKWVGIEQTNPLAAVRETVDMVRALQCGETVQLSGAFVSTTPEAYLRFQASRLTPIYIGAMGPKMHRLTGEIADGALPLLFPPEHYFSVRPLVAGGEAHRDPQLLPLDFAACVWVSLSDNLDSARRVLAQKVAYYGHALGPLIWDRLGLERSDFDAIEQAMMVERDEEKAVALVDDRMLQIGIVGDANTVIERLEPLVAEGANHLSFGPPLGPDRLQAIAILSQVIQYFR